MKKVFCILFFIVSFYSFAQPKEVKENAPVFIEKNLITISSIEEEAEKMLWGKGELVNGKKFYWFIDPVSTIYLNILFTTKQIKDLNPDNEWRAYRIESFSSSIGTHILFNDPATVAHRKEFLYSLPMVRSIKEFKYPVHLTNN